MADYFFLRSRGIGRLRAFIIALRTALLLRASQKAQRERARKFGGAQ